jgi:peptidyl-prolyl cis-trans isomerase D
MLDVLRRGASTWISKLLLGLLIVSFGVWGIADVFRGFGSNTAYHVGSHEIGVAELDHDYNREIQQIARRSGRPFTKDEALKTGVGQQILSRIVTDATIAEAARLEKLAVSDQTIREDILRDPTFKNAAGGFDRNRFNELLRSNGWNEDMYIVRRRADMLRAQLLDGMVGGQPAPKVLVEALDTFRNETRSIRYAVLSAAGLGTIAPPDEATLKTFFTDRARAFRAPERRTLSVLVLDPASIARPDDVSDDDAKTEYEARKARFTVEEKRRVLQVRVADAAAGATFLAALKGGKTFEQAAEDLGQKAEDIDLGLLARSAFADQTVAEAAWSLGAVGDVSGVVEGKFGPVVLKLADRVAGSSKSFAEVAPELKKEIAARRAENDVLSRHDQIEDALAGGAKIDEVAARLSMKVRAVDGVDREGRLADGKPVAGIPHWDDVLKGAFESDVGVENDAVDLGGKGFLWYAVTKIDPAHDQTLDEVKDRVVAAWTAEEVARRLGDTAKSLTERLAKGEDFETVAKSAGLEVKTSPAFKRAEPPEGLSTKVAAAAFNGPEGHVGTVTLDNGDTMLLSVADVTPPTFFAESDEAKTAASRISGSLRNSLLEVWLGQVRTDIGVTMNPAVVDRVTGRIRD